MDEELNTGGLQIHGEPLDLIEDPEFYGEGLEPYDPEFDDRYIVVKAEDSYWVDDRKKEKRLAGFNTSDEANAFILGIGWRDIHG